MLVEKDGAERLYFVVETKSSLFTEDLRDKESAKIECGKAHFKALAVNESPAEFIVATDIDDLMANRSPNQPQVYTAANNALHTGF